MLMPQITPFAHTFPSPRSRHGEHRRAVALHARRIVETIVRVDVAAPRRQRDVRVRRRGEARGIRVELRSGVVDVEAVVVRLASVERRPLELDARRVDAERHDAVAPVRRVLPMVADRREGIVLRRRPMHVRDRTERRIADGGDVDRRCDVARNRALERGGELGEQIVRMLSIHQPRTLERSARLEQLRIPVTVDDERLEARHRVDAKQAAGNRTERHEHFPIDQPDLPVAAKRALIVVLAERAAVEHQRPTAELAMEGVHRRRVRDPRRRRSEPRERNAERRDEHSARPHLRHVVLRANRAADERTSENGDGDWQSAHR